MEGGKSREHHESMVVVKFSVLPSIKKFIRCCKIITFMFIRIYIFTERVKLNVILSVLSQFI